MINDNLHTGSATGDLPEPGKALIASPFLKDPHFFRSVVFLCDHSEEGSFGFIINRLHSMSLNDLLPDTFNRSLKVYEGGPVQPDTLHFLHQYPELIEGGVKIGHGVYWGGNFEQMTALMNSGQLDESCIKFFIGYSGWSAGQLKNELQENSWIVSEGRKKLLFEECGEDNIWKEYLKSMGQEYAMMANYPIDPILN